VSRSRRDRAPPRRRGAPHDTYLRRRLHGHARDVAQTHRAHTEAFTAIHATHATLVAHADLTGRRAHRYLHVRYPDPALHGEVLAQLRYWPRDRLTRDVRAVLAPAPGGRHRDRRGHPGRARLGD